MKNHIELKKKLEIIEDVENNKYQSLDAKEFATMEASLKKTAANTIEKLKAVALNEGMPYQTYITYIIHRLTTSRLQAV